MRPATANEQADWDNLVAANPSGGNVFQTKAFAQAKSLQGLTPQFMMYDFAQKVACLYITRRIPLLGEVWYAPKGPGVVLAADLQKIIKANADFAKNHKKIFLFKLEPDVPKSVRHPQALRKVRNIQPNANTVIVDLSPPEDDILASFRQRARRAIRQAQAAGVTVKPVPANPTTYQQMFSLYKTTGQRGGFYVRDFSYYKQLWDAWTQAGQGQFFFAYSGDALMAAAFVAYLGANGLYKDGASDRAALKNGAAHLLQWEAMRWLKTQGVTSYDLHGTPPADQLENASHPFYGLGLFKTSFANNLTEFVGTLDQPINPSAYKLWQKFGERAAQSVQYRLRGRTFY